MYPSSHGIMIVMDRISGVISESISKISNTIIMSIYRVIWYRIKNEDIEAYGGDCGAKGMEGFSIAGQCQRIQGHSGTETYVAR